MDLAQCHHERLAELADADIVATELLLQCLGRCFVPAALNRGGACPACRSEGNRPQRHAQEADA
jgi:hypothetical protein